MRRSCRDKVDRALRAMSLPRSPVIERIVRDVLDERPLDGGPGSGNFGHSGRPGQVGGSGGGGGGGSSGGSHAKSPKSEGTERAVSNKGNGVSKTATPAPNKKTTSKKFVPKLDKAKATCPPQDAWRVDTYRTPEDFDAENVSVYTTDGGSTFAIKPDGDIISVCKNKNGDGGMNARDIMAAAVERGGTHLDSFDGNYGFYTKCGFEVVSRCKFDEQYAPPGWTKGRDEPEDVIFMRYVGVGKTQDTDKQAMQKRVPYSSDYDTAAQVLKDILKGGS